jgi:hypothetical protein
MDHRHRQLPTLDHDFRARTHPREQASKVIGGFRFSDMDHMVSHVTIIPSFRVQIAVSKATQTKISVQGNTACCAPSNGHTCQRNDVQNDVQRASASLQAHLGCVTIWDASKI